MTIDSVAITKAAVYNSGDNTIRVPSSALSGSVQINIPTNPRSSRVVTCGVPLIEGGTSTTAELMLRNDSGVEIPAQFDVVTRWPDGSIKAVVLTATVEADASSEKIYSLDYGAGVSQSTYSSNLGYTETATELTVSTGVSRIVIDKVTGLVKSAHADTAGDQSYATQVLGQAYISQQDGLDDTQYSSANETAASVTVSRSGPMQIMVYAVGRTRDVSNNDYTQYRIWYRFYKDSENFDVDYTMIDDTQIDSGQQSNFDISQFPANAFSCRNLSIVFPHSIASSPKYIFGGETNNSTGDLTGETYLLQSGYISFNTNAALSLDNTVVDFAGTGPESERNDKTGTGLNYTGVQVGNKAKGFCTVHNTTAGASAIFRNFWQEWPNELNLDTSNLTIGLHPERYNTNEGGVRNTFSIVNEFWKYPTTLYHHRHGMSKTFELTICIHSGTPDATTVEQIRDDRQNVEPQLRCNFDYYCTCKVWGDIQPSDANSAIYNDALYNNRLIYSQNTFDYRVQPHFWRHHGDTFRVDTTRNTYPKFSGNYNGSHLGGDTHALMYLTTGKIEWYEYAYRQSKFFMDVCHCASANNNYYANLSQPLPAGQLRIGKHETLDHDIGADLDSHLHVSALPTYIYLTGNPRAQQVMESISDYLSARMPWKCPLPRKATALSGINIPLGDRSSCSAERNYGWYFYCMNKYVEVSNDADYHGTESTQFMNFLIQWWQTIRDHKIGGVVVSSSDYTQGTGYWLNDQSENSGSTDTNTVLPFFMPSILQAVIDWYDLELKYGNSGIDLQTVRDMMYQTVQFVNYWGYNETAKEYYYSPYYTNSSDINAARMLMSPMSRVYLLYKTDLGLGRISNPEWYDDALWKTRILFYYNRWKTSGLSLLPQGFYGYETLFPQTFWKNAAIIEAE